MLFRSDSMSETKSSESSPNRAGANPQDKQDDSQLGLFDLSQGSEASSSEADISASSHQEPELPELTLPKFSYELRPYQVNGVKWLRQMANCGASALLADDMGLGKTHQVMALMDWVFQNLKEQDAKASYRVLVICPTSVLHHWENKLKKFHPSLKPFVYYGPNRNPGQIGKKVNVILTSYGIIRRDADLFADFHLNSIVLCLFFINFSNFLREKYRTDGL
mgnify:CR=1 FL=1